MHAVCELAEVLRDVIVEYQVCVNLEPASELFPEHWIVCTTEGNLRPQLQIDCKPQVILSGGILSTDMLFQDAGQISLHF